MGTFKEAFQESAVDFGSRDSNLGDSFISTGSRALNLIFTGHPEIGIVQRRIYEYIGWEGCGKTTLAIHAIADCQAKGGKGLYIDAEHALDPFYMQSLRVDINKLDIGEPDCGEQAFDMIEWGIANRYDLIVTDSVATMTPRREIEGDIGDANMGLHARLMGQGMRRINSKLTGNIPTSLIFINQMRMKIGVLFGNPETTPGGKAMRFFSSVRLDMRDPRGQKVLEGKLETGKIINCKSIKNKLNPPFQTVKIHIDYGTGIDKIKDFAAAMKYLELAEVTKKMIRIKGRKQMNLDTFSQRMRKDKKFNHSMKNLLLEGAGQLSV